MSEMKSRLFSQSYEDAKKRQTAAPSPSTKWYSGSKPTARETIARIHTVADGNKDTFNNLYSKFLTAQSTKGSIYYNPYTKATNSKAIDGLAGLGIDVSGGITQDFLDQYVGLRNYDRTASGYSPLAPTKSSTPEQNAAYYFNQLQDAEPTTQAAEQEWAQMQKELTYWANRGLSDEEAIAKLDWKNYKTLAKMDEKKSTGDALILNRPVGYSSDAMYGTLWAARNNGGTGNALADMANSARGVGNVYKRDAFAEDQRNPASKNYNPYTRATIDSALINLGVDKIDDEWLAANRSMLATDQADLYRDLYEINEDTKVAQAEYALLQKNVDRWLKAGYSAEDIARVFEEDADNEYGTLKKMDEARLLGKPYALGDAVNYRWEDVYADIQKRVAIKQLPIEEQAQTRKDEYVQEHGDLFNGDNRETAPGPGWNGLFQRQLNLADPAFVEQAAEKWLDTGLPDPMGAFSSSTDRPVGIKGVRVLASAGASDASRLGGGSRVDEINETLENIDSTLANRAEYGEEYILALEQQKRELEAEKISLQGARTNETRDDLGADPIDPPENGYNPPKADSEAAVTPDGGTNRVDKIDATLANIEAELANRAEYGEEYILALEQQKRELEAERISLQGDAANKMLVEEKPDLQLDTKIADYQTVSQQIADLESTTEVDPEVLADIDAQREELKQELANNQIDKVMYDKLMKRVDERLAFWQATAEEENRPEREKLTAEKDRLEGELLDVIRSKDATDQEKVSAAATIGAWDAAAKYQFNAIKEKLSANAEYSKFLEANGGAQAAAKVLCSYVLAGEDLKNLENLDEATRAELEKYQTFCEEALGLYEGKELYNFLDAALGGALKNTKYNEGVGLFSTLAYGLGMGAAQFNDVVFDVAGALITAYGYMVEGSEWLCEQLGLGKSNTNEKYKQAGTAVSSFSDKAYAKMDQYLLENASTLEYFTARATAEGTKIAGEVVIGTGLAGAAKTTALGTLKTGTEALKLEQTFKYLGQVPFLAESFFGTGMDTYEQTGSGLRSIVAGMASAMATAVTSDLGVLGKMDDIGAPFVQSVIDKVASVPGSSTMAALKRWGIASVQFFTNLLKTGNGEGLQEVVEYVLSEPVVYALREGKSFLSKGLAEIGAEAAGNYIWGAISSFGATMQTFPSYARSVVAAEGMMGNSKLTPKDVVDLVEAYLADLNDPAVVAAMEKNAEQDAVEVQTGLLIAQDTGLQSLIEASEDAKEAAVQAIASAEAADAALAEAQSAVQENPSPETAQAYKEALADQTQAAAKAEQATAQSDKAAQKAAEGLAQKRSEAKSMVALIQQSLAEQREAAKLERAEQKAWDREVEAQIAQPAQETKETIQTRSVVGGDTVQAAVSVGGVVTGQTPNQQSGVVRSNPVETAQKLLRDLGVGEAVGARKMGGVPSQVLGYFATRPEFVAVRSKHASNLAVTMHEVGHAIAKKIGMTGTTDMVANLPDAFKASYAKSELPGEAFAEFMWRYIVSPEQAVDFAGQTFVESFEAALRKNHLDKAVRDARRDVQAFIGADYIERLGAMIKRKSEVKNQNEQSGFARRFFTAFADSTEVASDVDKKAAEEGVVGRLRNTALLRNFAARKATNLLTSNLTDINNNIIGDSLADRLKEAGLNGKDRDLFAEYLVTLHSIDRDAQGKEVLDSGLFSTDARQDFIDRMKAEHPEFEKAESAFQTFRKEFMEEYLVRPGYISQDLFDRLNTIYPHYVPSYRAKSFLGGKSEPGSKKTFSLRRASGSTETLIDPFDSFFDMVNDIVRMNADNAVSLEFDRLYRSVPGMGIFARPVESDRALSRVSTEPIKAQIEEILTNEGTDTDVIDTVMNILGDQIEQIRVTNSVNGEGYITVQRPDGSRGFYEVFNAELFKLLSNAGRAKGVLTGLGRLTNTMTMLTTGGNPLFAVRNFARDFQQSVNQGSWAYTYADGALKWLRAAYDVLREKGEFVEYEAFGGGGWTRVDMKSKKNAAEIDGEVFKGYNTANIGRTAKWAGKKVWNTITMARLNEVVEQASRYAEYKYGKHDKSTSTGRAEAFLAAQDVTTDFARAGDSELAATIRQVVPFFNASMQGVYKQVRMATDSGERSRLAARLAKTIINQGVTTALSALLILKFCDEDDKEEFKYLSDDLKSKHIYLPNFAPSVFGDAPYIRIPIAQDGLSQVIHGVVLNAAWAGLSTDSSDEWVLDPLAIANSVLDGLNPINGTIWDPTLAMVTNKNWYGGNIVPTRMQNDYAANQYDATTPQIFVDAGRAANISPLKLMYLVQQYTGFLGQVGLPALSKDENTGEAQGLRTLITTARNMFTSDPLKSNDVVGAFYDGASVLDQVSSAASKGQPASMLRRGLSPEELKQAGEEAYEMTHSGGVIYETKKQISALYDEIDEINANQTLSESDKYELASARRREIVDLALTANEAYGAYKEKYITGLNVFNRWQRVDNAAKATAYEKASDLFKSDYEAGRPYAARAYAVWENTGKDSAIPHPKESFDKSFDGNKRTFTVTDSLKPAYDAVYMEAYEKYVDSISQIRWDEMDEEAQLEVLKTAHTKGHTAAKNWYLEQLEVKE